jgi:hypothetical protein
MNIKKTVLFLLLISLCPAVSPAAEYTISPYNISLTYPDNWQPTTSHEKGSLVLGGVSISKQTGMQFRMYNKSQPDIKSFIDWYVKDYIRQMEQHWRGSKMKFTQITTPRTKQGYYTTSFTYKQTDGTIYIIHHYFWDLDRNVFVILGGVPQTEQLQYELKFDYIAQSVRFNK